MRSNSAKRRQRSRFMIFLKIYVLVLSITVLVLVATVVTGRNNNAKTPHHDNDIVAGQNRWPGKKIAKNGTIFVKTSKHEKNSTGEEVPVKEPGIMSDLTTSRTANSDSKTRGVIVVIDPGHQAHADLSGESIGPGSKHLKEKTAGGATGTKSKTPEYKIALAISEKLKAKLEALGIKVIMTRESNDVDLSNIDRARIANRANAMLSVRIHCDGTGDTRQNGISTLYPALCPWTKPIYDQSLKAARIVQKDVVAVTKHKDNGVVPRSDLTGFNWSKVPVILVETGFLSNVKEDASLNDPSYQDLLAEGISEGVTEYLQLQ